MTSAHINTASLDGVQRSLYDAGTFPTLLAPGPASSVLTLTDKDGNDIAAYEIAFKLNVIALQNSVSAQEILDFKKGCSKYCGLKLGFRNTIKVLPGKPAASTVPFIPAFRATMHFYRLCIVPCRHVVSHRLKGTPCRTSTKSFSMHHRLSTWTKTAEPSASRPSPTPRLLTSSCSATSGCSQPSLQAP